MWRVLEKNFNIDKEIVKDVCKNVTTYIGYFAAFYKNPGVNKLYPE